MAYGSYYAPRRAALMGDLVDPYDARPGQGGDVGDPSGMPPPGALPPGALPPGAPPPFSLGGRRRREDDHVRLREQVLHYGTHDGRI